MSIEKIVEIDLIEIVRYQQVQVREKTTILENGEEISNSFKRWVISPGMDYSNQDPKIIKICKLIHTEEVINEYLKSIEENKLLN